MKQLSTFFSLIFTMIFFLQSSAWATGNSSPYSAEIMEKVVKHYNSLSLAQKQAAFKKEMKSWTKADQDFFKAQAGDISLLKFPELKLKNGEFSFTVDKKEINFKIKSEKVMVFHGQEIEVGPGKMQSAVLQFEKIMNQHDVSFMSYFINSAYAIGFIAYGLIWIAIYLVTGAAMVYSAIADEKRVVKVCQALKDRIEEESPLTPEESQEISEKIDEEIESFSFQNRKNCLKKDNSDSAFCKLAEEAVACLTEVKNNLSPQKAVDESDRGLVKDVDTKKSSEKNKRSDASKQ